MIPGGDLGAPGGSPVEVLKRSLGEIALIFITYIGYSAYLVLNATPSAYIACIAFIRGYMCIYVCCYHY